MLTCARFVQSLFWVPGTHSFRIQYLLTFEVHCKCPPLRKASPECPTPIHNNYNISFVSSFCLSLRNHLIFFICWLSNCLRPLLECGIQKIMLWAGCSPLWSWYPGGACNLVDLSECLLSEFNSRRTTGPTCCTSILYNEMHIKLHSRAWLSLVTLGWRWFSFL